MGPVARGARPRGEGGTGKRLKVGTLIKEKISDEGRVSNRR
jgi:hypothetical protein